MQFIVFVLLGPAETGRYSGARQKALGTLSGPPQSRSGGREEEARRGVEAATSSFQLAASRRTVLELEGGVGA